MWRLENKMEVEIVCDYQTCPIICIMSKQSFHHPNDSNMFVYWIIIKNRLALNFRICRIKWFYCLELFIDYFRSLVSRIIIFGISVCLSSGQGSGQCWYILALEYILTVLRYNFRYLRIWGSSRRNKNNKTTSFS